MQLFANFNYIDTFDPEIYNNIMMKHLVRLYMQHEKMTL